MAGSASKRVTLHQKYKIAKRVKEHKRKLKKAQKKNAANGGGLWRTKTPDMIVPNDWPFKQDLLTEIERQKAAEKEAEEKNKAARKAASEKKKRQAALGKPTVTETALPSGMGAPAPVPSSTTNAILLDAYTRRVWREIKQVVEESDIILEVLDARDPLGSRCFEMEEWVNGKLVDKAEKKSAKDAAPASAKPIILVLNKCDLVPVSVTQAWIEFFAKHDHLPCIAFYSNKELEKPEKKGQVISPKEICAGAESLLQLIANFQSSADEAAGEDAAKKPIKVGIVGFGNVGKSSVLNTLARTHASGCGPIPGFTKALLRYKLGKGLYAIDTPAVPTKEEAPGPHTFIPLSNNRIIDQVGDFVQHFDMDNLMSVLNLPQVEDMEQFLDHLASRAGRQMKGGKMNHVVAARKLFNDWNAGKLHFFTPPPEFEGDAKTDVPDAGPIQSFFVASNNKTLVALKKRNDIPPESAFLSVNGSLFDEGEEEEEDEEEDDGEDGEDEEMMEDGEDEAGGEEDEDEEMVDEEEEEEEEPVPPPSKKKGKQQQQPSAASTTTKAQPPRSQPTPAKSAKSTAKSAAPTPAPASAKASRKRPSRDEDEEEEEEEKVAPTPKKQAAAPKANSSKPTPKAAPQAPQSASAKKGKGKK